MTEKKNKGGRPTIYSRELARKIFELLMMGNSLRSICKRDDMPAMSTVMKWLSGDGGEDWFVEQYAHARAVQAEYYLDEMIDIADETSNDFMVTESGNERVNHEHINRSKLRIDSRKWLIEKLAARKYGNRIEVDNKSSDGSMSPQPAINLSELSDEELRALSAIAEKTK